VTGQGTSLLRVGCKGTNKPAKNQIYLSFSTQRAWPVAGAKSTAVHPKSKSTDYFPKSTDYFSKSTDYFPKSSAFSNRATTA